MQEFIAKSPSTIKALNTLRVSASLPVNILVTGDEGVGKKTLIRSVFKDIKEVSVKDALEVSQKEIFITDLEKCIDIVGLMRRLKDKRVIAISKHNLDIYEEFFPIILNIPPLSERKEDLEALKAIYIKELKEELGIELKEDIDVDVSKNAVSLKRDIFLKGVLSSLDEKDVLFLVERFVENRLEEGYKNLTYILDVPILRAAKRKYKSTLAISKAINLNRATVTSKLKRWKKFL